MGCIDLVRCVLVLRCGLTVVMWYPYAGWSTEVGLSLLNYVDTGWWMLYRTDIHSNVERESQIPIQTHKSIQSIFLNMLLSDIVNW